MRQLEHIENLLTKPANKEVAFNEVNKAIELLKLEATKEKKSLLKGSAEKLQILTYMMQKQHLRNLPKNYKFLHNKLDKETEK